MPVPTPSLQPARIMALEIARASLAPFAATLQQRTGFSVNLDFVATNQVINRSHEELTGQREAALSCGTWSRGEVKAC